ncbi:cbb3-type cytochrome c oxidase subunit I [Commensalibacter papalotli (ex Botero et al. 2024)]|uniref:Subunit 1 (CyoB) (PDB:1AR1) n=1 Tax=Commensalibacter papalotli (ex Botero et al. 2024) TaxID=2972766 RepID=A0ABN8W8K7_9PROT|nr:cbb3-type cytochrome c oxidase subunit I [Commensalibacter papalotli (ex Botero et al. 2024)]CAI3923370.1 Heme/copper-type cytochrome/quinol oxidase [Commensalibacter papalotli (ex Botero et al. 2024)]CAI3928668.1 Heme/copper-type cytochrome/quinol oxidase [Commensalibacter papalotli (ex Botero et al. 2024)]
MNTHYKIGMSALFLAILAGISGGIAALFVQLNTYIPVLGKFSTVDFIQNLPRTHARMMVFFVLQPALMLGFGAWFVPLLIKAKDMAFKGVNAFSLLCLVIGFICNFLTFLYPDHALFALYSLGLWSISAVLFSINMLITIINNRAPDVSYASLPLFVWGQGISAALLLPTASILLAALTKNYYHAAYSAAALQQTVRSFSYPMLMILIIPAICMVFHIITTISNQSIKQNKNVILMLILVPFIVLLSWNKMIFNTHLISMHQNITLQVFYACALYALTLFLLVYCIKLFFVGEKHCPAPVLWSFGFIGLLAIGWPYQGITKEVGLIHSSISYGILFAVFAGFYFWMGKILGKQYSELLAKIHFITTCVGVVFTLDMFVIGEKSILIGAVFMGLSLLSFIVMLVNALRSEVKLPSNYWGEGAITNEWQLPSPVFSHVK